MKKKFTSQDAYKVAEEVGFNKALDEVEKMINDLPRYNSYDNRKISRLHVLEKIRELREK